MNDDFNKNSDDEVVDSIPEGAKSLDDDNSSLSHNNYSEYNSSENRSFKTKVIIENGPPSLASKIAFMLALGSVIFFLFPAWSFFCALLSIGIALICISNGSNGRIVSVFAIGISIFGSILAALSGFLWLILKAFLGLFF